MNKNILFFYVVGILVSFAYGVSTAEYKIFPYKELREIKRLIIHDKKAHFISSKKKNTNLNYYPLHKKTFFEEHMREAEIVMLGDSITDDAEWEALFPSKKIVDYGIGGNITSDLLDRLDLIYKTNASKVFIMVGINDLSKGIQINEITNNYQKVVNELIKNDIETYIQSTLYLGNHKEAINNEVLVLNNFLKNYADAHKLVTFIDLNSSLSNNSFLLNEYSHDGKGLNGKGYKVWRDIISPYIM